MAYIIMIAAVAAAVQPTGETCRRVHIFADGHVETSVIADEGQGASATSASSGKSASSHVSASSSSSGTSSSSAISTSDGEQRSVTITRGAEGCRITIDERPHRRE